MNWNLQGNKVTKQYFMIRVTLFNLYRVIIYEFNSRDEIDFDKMGNTFRVWVFAVDNLPSSLECHQGREVR